MRVPCIRWLAAGAILYGFLFPSCTSGQTPASKAEQPAAQSPQWITHKDPQLYSVESPRGWTVSPDKQKGWVHLKGTEGEHVVIWPVFVPGAVDPRFASLIHARLAGSSPYQAQWETPQAVTANTLRARGTSANAVAISVFTWVPSPTGLAGFFYVVSAREPNYQQKQGDFARILQSFRIMGAATGAKTVTAEISGVRYVRFADPREGAFTMDVPAGWKTEGGLFRFHALDTRHCVETTSPDGQIKILFGDPSIGPMTDPRSLTSGMFPEGSIYAPYGLKMLVLRFMPGAEFCRYWLLTRVSPNSPDLQVTEMQDLTDQFSKPSPSSVSPPPTYGGAWFRGSEQGQPRVGRCVAGTQWAGPTIGPWLVRAFTGYSAPPERASIAEAIWQHLGGSFQWNVQWQMAQVGIAGGASRAVSGVSNEIADMVARSQRTRDAIDDEIARRRSNATLGVVDVADPQTGRRMTVESGSNYYWVDQSGVIIGTNTDTRPNIDFRALLEIP